MRCGEPARATGVVDAPGHDRWLDRCMPCLIATTRAAAPVPLWRTPLREAAREAGVTLAIAADES
jgi:hypothetical protein